MPFRRKMNSKASRRNFKSGHKQHGRNFATAMRGGYRI